MTSLATRHYPQTVFRRGRRWLWNPVLKKTLSNRPEERVRLRLLEYLLYRADLPPGRIGFEHPVRRKDQSTTRADLLYYDRELRPHLLIECKSDKHELTEQAASQIARYNQRIGAPYVLISNGLRDLLFQVDAHSTHPVEHSRVPGLQPQRMPDTGVPSYWQARGFLGSGHTEELTRQLTGVMGGFWDPDALSGGEHITWLDLIRSLPGERISHYYRIFPDPQGRGNVALSFLADQVGSTRLIGVLNRKGINTGIAEIDLEILLQKQHPHIIRYIDGQSDQSHLEDTDRLKTALQDPRQACRLLPGLITDALTGN